MDILPVYVNVHVEVQRLRHGKYIMGWCPYYADLSVCNRAPTFARSDNIYYIVLYTAIL